MHCVKSVRIRGFFWSVFSRIRTEYGEILSNSVRMRENTDQKISEYGHFSRSDGLTQMSKTFQTKIFDLVWN